ncbi:hypothetical protein HGM15179_012061 [Zosterops borbonicus]|uniref:Uncharacterized protein n=1 Tax=Zosterops borbonicus TaxID=364589 RepID=A0A8K1GC14_9PASS|nr:hypothetical protein HGM15179_012061 [Zosterops borbonicus]
MVKSRTVERDLEIFVDEKLNMSQQCPGSQEDQPCPGVRQAHHHQAREGIVPLCSELGWSHLECRQQFWMIQYKKDIKPLESIQRRDMTMVKTYVGRMKSLGLFSLEETEGRPHCSYNFLVRGRGGSGTDLFSVARSDRLCQGRLRSNIRKMFFTQRVAGHWNRLLREVVTGPSLADFGKCLKNTQEHNVIPGGVLCRTIQELDFENP